MQPSKAHHGVAKSHPILARAWGRALAILAVFAVLAALVAARPAAAQNGSVLIVSPRNLSTVIGETTVEMRVYPPSSTTVDRLVVKVDGKNLATLTEPPWSVPWDAGDGSRGHMIEALLYLSDGSLDRAVARTSALRINQFEEVGLVNLYPIVRQPGGGAYITDLAASDFRILENGTPQEIKRFSTARRALRIAIVLDASLTMEGRKLENAKAAALEFLDILEPTDECIVVTFSDDVRVLQETTSERELMVAAIDGASAERGTALYDAVWRSAKKLEEFDGRRVMVLLSDGRDEAYEGLGPGSLHTLDEALDQALRSEVMVFAIGLGRDLDNPDIQRRYTQKEILRRMGEETGGRALFSPTAGRLRRAFKNVADDLRNQYSIAYASSDLTRDGAWRRVEVLTPGRDLQVTHKSGYFASEDKQAERKD